MPAVGNEADVIASCLRGCAMPSALGQGVRCASAQRVGARCVPEFGAKVARARETAGLTQRTLASRSGLSLKTICNIEMGRHSPSHETVLRLLLVKELGLEHKAVPWRFRPKPETGSTPNCWIAPGYESLKMFAELIEAVHDPRTRPGCTHRS